jgi:chemotaxis protein histidine kinase CheA
VSIEDELRAHFRASARERLIEIEAALGALTRDANDDDALDVLRRHFHALSGLGGTYGFPRVSEAGDELEGALLQLRRAEAKPDPNMIARWRELVAGIARDLC